MKKTLLSLALLGIFSISMANAYANVHTDIGDRAVDRVEHAKNHPESMPKGYIGDGKVITGHDAYGNPIVGSCAHDYCPPPHH